MVKLRTVPWVQGVRYKQYTEYNGYTKNSTLGETRGVCPRYVLLVFEKKSSGELELIDDLVD